MDDLDQLLSDLENVSSKKSTPSNNHTNLKMNNQDFIESINQIVNKTNDQQNNQITLNKNKQYPRMGSLTTLNTNTSSNYSITNDEYDDEEATGIQLVNNSNLNLNRVSSNINNNHLNDLTELDNLLDDLYQAKQIIAKSNYFKPNSSMPQSSLSNLSALTTTGSGSESLSSSSSSPVSSINQKQNKNSSPQLNASTNTNTRLSVADAASKELEHLMQNLTMYKSNEDQENEIPIYDERRNQYFNNNINNTTNTNRMNNSNDARNLCFSCKGPINGQVITALGYLWHPNHFVCFHCNKSIGTSIFYEKDNKPYCENDYLNLFSPKCASCTHPILDRMLTALNKTWHISCFKCLSCKKVLNDESFLEINNDAYCKDCYMEELAPKCKRCHVPIIENFISALDSYWHPNCFVCQECGIPFNSTNFYEYMNSPYCEIHYHLKRGSLCAGCQQPINGRCITAMNKKFHPEHFNCSFCLKQLNKGTFKEQNEKPYCQLCFVKLFP